jgi:serine/threonine-protein kinase
MLFALAVLAAVGAAIAAVLLLHSDGTGSKTVVVTATSPAPSPSAPAVRVPVPDLAGRGAASAAAGLRRAGFSVVLTTVSSTLPKGSVVEQQPRPGTKARKGAEVRLSVSSGSAQSAAGSTTPAQTAPASTTTATTTTPAEPATAQVPALTGGALQPAAQQLARAGLRISIAYVPSTRPLGTVVAQSPDGGSSAKTGSQVTLNVAWGPRHNESESVPDVVGGRIRDALPRLQQAGLRLIFVRAPVADQAQAGVIVAQSPSPGARAPKNGQVLVYLGAFTAP